MQSSNTLYGIINIVSGIGFILVSLPLVKRKIPINNLYGFRIAKALSSDENWYKINTYGGRQLIRWSFILILIGILYFIFPVQNPPHKAMNLFFAVTPMLICVTAAFVKTHIYSKGLE